MFSKKKKTKIISTPKATNKPYAKNFKKTFLKNDDFKKWINTGTKQIAMPSNILSDNTIFFKSFLSAVGRYYPAASAAIWTWKNLCTTKQDVKFSGGDDGERNAAKEITNLLDERITPIKTVKSGGMNFLLSLLFKYLFTYGRFAGILKLNKSLNQVEGFQIIDPFTVKFDKLRNAYYLTEGGIYVKANPNTFYYYALDMDWENPYGSAMLEAAWSMMEMADEMLQDMKLSSSNAGVPRLHIKIDQPEKIEGEEDVDYSDRISTYFDSYIQQFSDIAPDDNFYSWDDVTISTVGGLIGGGGFVWKGNRQVFDEEILSAFHLFPWIVGKSSQTTKNWVRSQFDLLLAVVESLQEQATNFANWITNTNLKLHNIQDIRSNRTFERLRDPAAKDFAIAQSFKIANIKNKILMGMISSDDGARELGYDKAHDDSLIFENKDNIKGINEEDGIEIPSQESIVDELEFKIDSIIEDKIENLKELTGGENASNSK